MIHLTVHLVDEVKQGRPVHYRWMYFVERLLGHFKSLLWSKSQSEGSIAEGHKVEEVLTLYSRYLTKLSQELLTTLEKTQAHRYVLLNSAAVKPFIDEFRQHIKRSTRGRRVSTTEVEKRVSKEFPDWFPKRIMNPDFAETISDDIKFLAQGPAQDARRFSSYNINGFKFGTLSREQGSKTQNSGVFLISDTSCIASSVDRCARQADLPYYGKLEDIIELNYYGRFKVILFKCLWADTTRNKGYKIDA
ncbi:hypothetical protein KY290_008052 [Solanum tuberosum]|uniref:DUF4218 domain-containing protein n=1 Tax=Solanum tuberosum TaxID=4113 RepID=A0ABQ7W8N0_SOLTU|nr:hypothetical protein KY290_008052 [Solanum tuberosum]